MEQTRRKTLLLYFNAAKVMERWSWYRISPTWRLARGTDLPFRSALFVYLTAIFHI